MKSSVMLGCLLGSTALFAAPTLTVIGNHGPNKGYDAQLWWEGASGVVTIERHIEGAADWESLGTSSETSYLDAAEETPYGRLCEYRVADDDGVSNVVSYRRLRRLSTSEATPFSNGTVYKSRSIEHAFDGHSGFENGVDDTSKIFESNESRTVKVGIDFGSASVFVSHVEMFPRHNFTSRMADATLYGSMSDSITSVSVGVDRDVKLTDPLDLGDGGERWHGLDVAEPQAFRSYYLYNFAGNTTVGEVELYGWLLSDVSNARVIDCDFAVSRSDWENSHAQLTWTAAKTEGAVSVERQISDGEWETLAEDLETGAYTDTTMPYGHTIRYRLSQGENLSKELTFVRMHRLTTTPYTVWSNAKTYWNGQKEDRAFDGQWEVESGDCMSYPDISDSYSERANYPKVGVDFGRATHYVAMVRMFPRTQSNCMYMMNDAVVYGSKRSASQESLDGILGTPVTEKAGGVDEKRWYELAGLKRAEEVEAYRCYYYYHVTGGCANECEFYGWTRDDLTEEIPLNFSVERIDLEDFFPRLSWNDISINGVSVQRRIAGETGWAEIAKIDAGEEPIYEDTKIKYGFLYEYRLVYDGEESEAIAFRRLRRLTPEMGKLFTNSPGPVNDNPSHAAEMAFDGDPNNYVELNRLERGDDRINPKVGIDFGAANVAIEFVRFCPRHEWEGNIHHSHTTILYGSRHTAEEECATLDNATALTEPTTFEDYKFEWQERTVSDPQYFRTFYYQGSDNYQAGMAEVEFYGWFKTDIIRPFVILVK